MAETVQDRATVAHGAPWSKEKEVQVIILECLSSFGSRPPDVTGQSFSKINHSSHD
jgi:hypothetical protein